MISLEIQFVVMAPQSTALNMETYYGYQENIKIIMDIG